MSEAIISAQAHIDGKTVAQMGLDFAGEFRGIYPTELLGYFLSVGPMQSFIGLAVKNGHLSTPDLISSQAAEIERLREALAHANANHAEMVARNRVLRDRPDLPVDRLPALDHFIDRAETAERLLAEARAALEPFATYMQDGGDRDNKGEPLPDDQGVGWVYLTMGHFRTAARTLTNGGENGR